MNQTIEVSFKRIPGTEDLPLPQYQSSGASGLDLHAACSEDITLNPGERQLIPTGLQVEIPAGYEGQIRPRSGLAARHGVTVLNTPGTVDADYRGEIKVILANLGAESFTVRRGDRIAQMVFVPVVRAVLVERDDLSQTVRGDKGFGSTGIEA